MTQVQSIGEVGSGRFCVWWGRRCGLPEDRVGVLVAVKDAYVLPQCPGLGFWVPLSIERNQGSLGKGILPGLGQGKHKRSLPRQAHNGRKWGGAREKLGLDWTVAGARLRKSQPSTLTLVDEKGWGGTCLRALSGSPNNTLTNHRGTVTWQKPGGLTLPKVHGQHHGPLTWCREHSLTFCAVLPKMHNLEQEKTTDKSKLGNIPQSNWPALCKVAGPWHERTGELSTSRSD